MFPQLTMKLCCLALLIQAAACVRVEDILAFAKVEFANRTYLPVRADDFQEYAVLSQKNSGELSYCQGSLDTPCTFTYRSTHSSADVVAPSESTFQVHFAEGGNVSLVQLTGDLNNVIHSAGFNNVCPQLYQNWTVVARRRSFNLGQYTLFDVDHVVDQVNALNYCRSVKNGPFNGFAQVDSSKWEAGEGNMQETIKNCWNTSNDACASDVDSGEILSIPSHRQHVAYHRANVTVYAYCCENPTTKRAHKCINAKTKKAVIGCVTLVYDHASGKDFFIGEDLLEKHSTKSTKSIKAIPLLHSDDKFLSRSKVEVAVPKENYMSRWIKKSRPVHRKMLMLMNAGDQTNITSIPPQTTTKKSTVPTTNSTTPASIKSSALGLSTKLTALIVLVSTLFI